MCPAVPGLQARALASPTPFPSIPSLEGTAIAQQVLGDRKEKNHPEGTEVRGSTSAARGTGLLCQLVHSIHCEQCLLELGSASSAEAWQGGDRHP